MEDRTPTGGRANPPPENARQSSAYGSDMPTSTATSAETARWRSQAAMPPTGYGSITSGIDRRQQSTGTSDQGSSTAKPKKPSMSRRATSSKFPHKGQEFSVDDAEEEVQLDQAQLEQLLKQHRQPQPLRRKPSTVRRKTGAQPATLTTIESTEDDEIEQERAGPPVGQEAEVQPGSSEEETVRAEDDDDESGTPDEDDDEAELSDTESFTLRDRQDAINVTHPFGIRIWKPALYKKGRSVQRNAEADIHSSPGLFVSRWLVVFNIAWTLVFGWWLAIIAAGGGLLCAVLGFDDSCREYSHLLLHLAVYVFYPFGKYVKLLQDDAYVEEDEGEGRSISEYEQWQSGDIEEGRLFFGPTTGTSSLIGRRRNSVDSSGGETTSLLGRDGRANIVQSDTAKTKRRLFGRGKWNLGRVIFFVYFYGILTPALFLVSGLCFFLVFTIPMGKVTLLLFDHLRRHPLALSFHSDNGNVRRPGESSSILLCTYRAVGIKYWKYTIDGTNIFLINLLGLVAFTIFDYWVLDEVMGLKIWLTDQFLLFTLALLSIIPLAYFIGQAVASISAQSSMGVGATINAFFSTVVEVFLYCVALKQGKAQLVEGSIIGSIFAGILFLPGLSMCFGALKRKTQRFNVRSAGVTSTMLLFAVIGAFGPTLFYQVYGSHELNCHSCITHHNLPSERDCRRCYYSQVPALNDRFYNEAVKPYTWFAAALLFCSYVIGLLFTLRTHAATIWTSEPEEKEKKPMEMSASGLSNSGHLDFPHSSFVRQATGQSVSRAHIRDSQLYKRIVGQTLHEVGLGHEDTHSENPRPSSKSDGQTPHMVPPKDGDTRLHHAFHVEGLTDDAAESLARQITEIAATTTALATRDVTRDPRKAAHRVNTPSKGHAERPANTRTTTEAPEEPETAPGHTSGGHDAPNWSRQKSAAILLSATIAYAIIAEILVNTVDAVLDGSDIDEKFLGITLFALVPNTTEFLNAISFAMNGNIALSMEIGSAYALQVCLLQIPALVFYSAVHASYIPAREVAHQTFTLIFPQWDMITVILCVFLLSYMYGEGKSNYFKGSILILSYLVVIAGFYLSGFNMDYERMGVDPNDTLALGGLMEQSMTFKTAGRGRSGAAY
ncbi:calcium permease family membrane transporter-like protein [Cucurbitaria berberidis CBS 394.84]|uniref:Calcium permease family membrane transporter-like protein n=1 Tax=Cucurbitaria berberidis CBS 394.84 TaxID=1168544 RepID=A0A9P4L5P2_9PLEO|nr:calcium permease family membrane transporter-like protein [Cucurbitaria berberidis CBS 394.84]KAF1842527.1 calcium permease family membrane transporter-like protein [Cucurbitaria berberidis CBS 394.84]